MRLPTRATLHSFGTVSGEDGMERHMTLREHLLMGGQLHPYICEGGRSVRREYKKKELKVHPEAPNSRLFDATFNLNMRKHYIELDKWSHSIINNLITI